MRRPPIPIPSDMLDPRDLPGVQPSPWDKRYSLNPGKTLKLAHGLGDGVQNQSEYITEWVVKILPPPETVLAVGGGEGYGFRAQVLANYNGDQFTEYQPVVQNNALPLEIPLVGVCLGVHGRFINCRLDRNAIGSTGELEIQIAIVPGRPSLSFVNRRLSVAGGGTIAAGRLGIPTFSTRFSLGGNVQAGDVLYQLGADGAGIVQTVPYNGSGQAFPVHPDAAFIAYQTFVAGTRDFAVAFEVNS